ncbi:MAG: hypothetical protein NUV56_00495 [Candidatus Uhrbacteria bacterium]|nr:hypothetical protein [Candidatus Uhrbacteria bacterium]
MRSASMPGVVIGLVALGLITGVLAWKGYIPTPWTNEQSGRVASLAPSDWRAYESDVWSVAYPSDWEVVVREDDGAVSFRPASEADKSTYFLVRTFDQTLVSLKNEYEAGPAYRETDILIANYETTKYDFGDGHIEYVIDYTDRVVVISTELPNNDDVGIMLATFAFMK